MKRLPTAIVLTGGFLDTFYAKTCHGLLRGTYRYEICGVVDQKHHGRSTIDFVPDGKELVIYETIEDYIEAHGAPEWCIVGVAFLGGVMPSDFRSTLLRALSHGISVVNGLHALLTEDSEFMAVAQANSANVIDIRKPKTFEDLHFWTGRIVDVKTPKIAILGTDCAVGKRTTAKMLLQELRRKGVRTEMIYTGQTGWLEGHSYGTIVDSTLNDFVSGELEHAVVKCVNEASPEIILIEGQSSLRNPTGPCGSELIISLQCEYVILQHDPQRLVYDDDEELGIPLPSVASEIALVRQLGGEVIAVAQIPRADASRNRILDVPTYNADKAGITMLADLVASKAISSGV